MTSPDTGSRPGPFDRFARFATATELANEHRELDRIFADACERAASGDWRECDAIWDDFTRKVEIHMRLEEELVFPNYRRESPAAMEVVDGLRAEHDALRVRMFQLGIDIQLHLMRAEHVEELVAALRAHAHREDETLHPWLATRESRQLDAPPR